jgi:hypothetical protein
VRLEGLGQLKKSNDLMGNRTRDLQACSIGTRGNLPEMYTIYKAQSKLREHKKSSNKVKTWCKMSLMENWVKFILKIRKKKLGVQNSEIYNCAEKDAPDISVIKEYECLRFYKDP